MKHPKFEVNANLWRGSLLPLGCAAVLNHPAWCVWRNSIAGFGAAAQPGGSKLPRHNSCQRLARFDVGNHQLHRLVPTKLVEVELVGQFHPFDGRNWPTS